MFDLKCKRKGCVYNKNNNCTAKKIEVADDTSCKTYEPSNEAEVGEVERVGQPPLRADTNVGCKADCIFNNDCICTANGITVQTMENVACPNCCTYMPK